MLRQILEKCYEKNIDIHCLFIDFKQAFDSVNRTKLEDAKTTKGIPTKLIRLIKMTYMDYKGRVNVQNKMSEPFKINTGLKQGDALSILLFNLALQKKS